MAFHTAHLLFFSPSHSASEALRVHDSLTLDDHNDDDSLSDEHDPLSMALGRTSSRTSFRHTGHSTGSAGVRDHSQPSQRYASATSTSASLRSSGSGAGWVSGRALQQDALDIAAAAEAYRNEGGTYSSSTASNTNTRRSYTSTTRTTTTTTGL